MKKKGSESDTLNHRNKAILKIYKTLKKSCQYESMYAICKAISVTPATRYYISEAMADIIWSKWRRTEQLPMTGRYKRQMYTAFIKECERISRKEGGSNRSVVRAALDCEAPCIGVSPYRIFVILKQYGMK
jgi:hypothetical protein